MAEQQFPEPIVGALIFNLEKKVLLIKSHKWSNKYVVPGGHIELGEAAEVALKREIEEETGLDIYDPEFIAFQEAIYDNAFWKKRHFVLLDFACKTKSTKVKLNDEGQEHIWISIQEALKLPIAPYTRRLIEEYLKKKNT